VFSKKHLCISISWKNSFHFMTQIISKLSMSGKTYWSEKPDLTLYVVSTTHTLLLKNMKYCRHLCWASRFSSFCTSKTVIEKDCKHVFPTWLWMNRIFFIFHPFFQINNNTIRFLSKNIYKLYILYVFWFVRLSNMIYKAEEQRIGQSKSSWAFIFSYCIGKSKYQSSF
jgi:hypothetical protein